MLHPESKYATITCMGCGDEIVVPIYCGNRFCVDCNGARRKNIRNKLDVFCAQKKETKAVRFKFLTLTIKSQPDLKEMVEVLLKSFRQLRQRQLWKKKVFGGAFVIEMTVNNGLWHAHIHAILEGYYISWDKLLSDWEAITGATGVHIKAIPVQRITHYLTKYITKTDLDEDCQLEASEALKGKRLFQPFGSWHNGFGNIPKIETKCSKCGQYEWNFGTLSMIIAMSTSSPDMPERSPPEEDEFDPKLFYTKKQRVFGFEEYVDAPF